MDAIPLGVGNAFSDRFYHNNFIFQFANVRLLVDAGTTLRYSLPALNLKPTDIHYITITNFHTDNVGGLEEFLQRCYWQHWRWVNGTTKPYRPTLIMLESQKEMFEHIFMHGLYAGEMDLNTYCNVEVISEARFTTDHLMLEFINTAGLHFKGMPSQALKVTDQKSGRNVVYTSDIKNLSESGLRNHLDSNTAAIFQDLQLFHRENGVHAELEEVLSYYPKEYHSRIYGMHYGDNYEKYQDKIRSGGIQLAVQGQKLVFE